MNQSVIVSMGRTPLGSFLGNLSPLQATDLGAVCISEIINKIGIEKKDVQEVIMGNVLAAGLGQNPARQAQIKAGLPSSTPAFTVNKVCSSGLLSIILACQSIALGEKNILIAGGMESMSNAPYLLKKARNGYRMGNGELFDSMICDGLWDPYTNQHMGIFAEETAKKYEFTRDDQDEFAINSYNKAINAIKNKNFANELLPVSIPQRNKDSIVISEDQEPSRVNFEKLPTLKPAFSPSGTVTAANASSICDGSAAVLMMSEKEAKRRNLKPLAKIIANATFSQDPEWFTTAPIGAIEKVLEKAKLKTKDIDLFEINEAFSVVTMTAIQKLSLDPNKVNINGGAVALGHPIGCSGTRIVVTLLNAMANINAKRGIATLCNGGGEATAILVEAF